MRMAKQKEEVVEDEKTSSTKATAIALFKSFPKEVQSAIDEFVKSFKSTGDFAQTVMQLCDKHGLNKEEVGHVIKEKMKMLGLRPPNVNSMLGITKLGTEGSGELDEAAKEAAKEEEAGLPCISIALKGLNKNEIISGLNSTAQVMNIYYQEDDNSFNRIEFE